MKSQIRPLMALLLAIAITTFGIASPGRVAAQSPGTSGPEQRVIVVLRSTPTSGKSHGQLASRRSWVLQAQAPVLAQLTQVKATRLRSLWLINSIAARMTDGAIARLRANPSVRAIVPDLPVTFPQSGSHGQSAAISHRPKSRAAATCTSASHALLEPEALQLTNTAFSNRKISQAQNLVNGSGVTVAFLADDIDVNTPDLIRSNGSHVITSYRDFTGDGTAKVTTPGGEAFGDASSIAAQGRYVYNADSFVNAALPQHKSCLPIRVEGMAPGASLMALKVLGGDGGDEATMIQAVQYAVAHGANIINESISSFRNPDSGYDPIEAANDAAVAAGVLVVGISWDGGTAGGTMFPPGTDPRILTAGASTQFQSYRQVSFAGSQVIKGGYDSNNISAISSSGVSDDGTKTVDVVAPGDLGWALCAPTNAPVYYGDCYNDNYENSPIQLFGGTSEAAPLTAGEAALVIEAYRNSHGGKSPSPEVVKQIIMSTSRDLGSPAGEQGAGLINSLAAVQAANSYRLSHRTGTSILTTPASLHTNLNPGQKATFSISATNNGAATETVTPRVVALSRALRREPLRPVLQRGES